MSPQTGYSGTPLAKKLGITEGSCVVTMHAPNDYEQLLAPVPAGAKFGKRVTESTDIVHVFATQRSLLETDLIVLLKTIKANGSVWVSWPKKASKVPTDITENIIREVCLALGFVDVKICAVSDIWSGLKLVIRKELR